MRRFTALAVGVVAALTLAACSDGDSTVSAGDDGATTSTTDGPTSTTEATTATTATTVVPAAAGVVLQIRTGGGFVPQEYAFAAIPQFTLSGDGRVIVTGPTTLEYPGAALPNVLTGNIGAAGVRSAVDAAGAAGLRDTGVDLGQPSVADAPTTSFVLVDGGRTYRVAAYALEFDSGGLTPAQVEARRRLQDLVRRMEALGAAAKDPYRPAALSVLVTPYPEQAGGAEPAPPEADWPLADLHTGGTAQFGGRCLVLTGADAETALKAAASARSNTRWRSGGATWFLVFRPELPGATPCVSG